MSNNVMAHIENEAVEFELSEKQLDFSCSEYRDFKIGKNLNLFLTNAQAEEMFDELDKKLHKETYSELQDKLFTSDNDLEKANDLIEMMEDNLVDTRAYMED